MNPTLTNSLRYWIKTREQIRVNKEAGEPRPWSDDPLINSWRWCNVDRNDDRETRWIMKNVVEKNHNNHHLWHMLVVCRFINWHETLEELWTEGLYAGGWTPNLFCRVMNDRRDRGEKCYTGAYMIRAGTGDDAKLLKEEYLCRRVFNPLWERIKYQPPPASTCQSWADFLQQTFGIGDFMTNQVITDMKYTHHLPRDTTPDWSTFVLLGPGTQRGLNRMFERPLKTVWRYSEGEVAINEVRKMLNRRLPALRHVWLDLNNVANCLCEFDKYQRLLNGEGEPRSKYHPSQEPLP